MDYAYGIYNHITKDYMPHSYESRNDKMFKQICITKDCPYVPISVSDIKQIKKSKNLQLVQAIFSHTKEY